MVGFVPRPRVQFDMQNLPKGVRESLEKLAAMKGLSIGLYCKTVLIEHALQNSGKK